MSINRCRVLGELYHFIKIPCITKWLFLLCTLILSTSLLAQTDELLEKAAASIAANDYIQAEQLFSQVLNSEPDNYAVLLKRGHIRSWQQKFHSAQQDFNKVLLDDPANIEALLGIGYSYAWSHNFNSARQYFNQVLLVDSNQVEARKGLANIALWSGQTEEAVSRFEALFTLYPDQEEVVSQLGQAYLAARKYRAASATFQHGLGIFPANQIFKEHFYNLRDLSPRAELNLWSGYSSFPDQGGYGFRMLDVGFWPEPATRLWFKYDNTLALDNPVLLRDGGNIPAYMLGAAKTFHSFLTLKMELGRRYLENESTQNIYLFEGTLFFLSRAYFKSGSLISNQSNNRTDITFYNGLGSILSRHIRAESVFYYTRANSFNETEWRLLLNGEYRFTNAFKLGAGFSFGHLSTPSEIFSGPRSGGFLTASIPFINTHWLNLNLRQERLPEYSYFISSLGLKLSLQRN